jgi:hypothetical protein
MHNHYLHFTATSRTVLSESSKNCQECFHSRVLAIDSYSQIASELTCTFRVGLIIKKTKNLDLAIWISPEYMPDKGADAAGQHWEEELHAAAQVPLHFATKATATAVAPNRWPPRRSGTSGAQKNSGPRGRGSQTSNPLLIVPATWCLGTIPRTSKGSASWREEDPSAKKKQRGMGRKRGAREGGAHGSGRRWRAGKEARARESIGAADSK